MRRTADFSIVFNMNHLRPDDDRIQRALEGLLSSEEEAALRADVVRDPKLRAAYVEQAWLHASLRTERDLSATVAEQAPLAAAVVGLSRKSRALDWMAAAFAVAACVALLFGVWAVVNRTSTEPAIATLVQADGCKWAGSDLPTMTNSQLGAGKLALVEGIAVLKFKSGAVVTLEAPSTLEMLSAMHCRLIEGTLTAEVPESAHGFTIDTADMKVIDLGTRFGLTSGAAGNSQVRVFEGEVEVDGLADGVSKGHVKRITEGQGLNVSSGAIPQGQEPTHGRQIHEDGGWTAIPTSFGRGKDAYVRRGDVGSPHGLQPLIIVKHTDLPPGRNNERRGILTFDLEQVDVRSISEAQLILDPEPSGFGFASLVPDSRFAVYGLVEESADAWDEKTLRWSEMPGCDDDGPKSKSLKLAEFWMARGGSGSPMTIRSEALADFVRTRPRGLVTLLIVRETGETDSSGLAHAFASKEHPTSRPPTLRLK
jgi:hypothetical protein